jgi:hypothetical protein
MGAALHRCLFCIVLSRVRGGLDYWICAASIFFGLWIFACAGCGGRPQVHALLDSEGRIYRPSEQEDFGSRTAIRMRGFEF